MRAELIGLPEPNWFHHGEAILDLLDEHRPMTCVELGSNRGCSAIAVARLIRNWGGRLTCVDRWQGGSDGFVGLDIFRGNIVASGVDDIITAVQRTTADAAALWDGDIDYLYVDADHSREGCESDLELWWPCLRVGGLIAGDDYDDVAGVPSEGVTAAWDAFEANHRQTFVRQATSATPYHGRLIWGVKR